MPKQTEKNRKFLLNMRSKIEDKDLEFFKTRNKAKYVLVKIKARVITTEFGNLVYKRRIYKYLENYTWKYVAFVDECFNFSKWSKIDPKLIEKIKQQIEMGERYQKIVDMFPLAKLSIMTISRIHQSMETYKKGK
ncbi:UPF0236 family transposase-like protein [Williamsoniiplasma lucivorax]|uniref:Uncharacterized protein n=1 Tax=Williamsoniiplasma lucivorax TaxID=209274 RepID=A0A2S5RFC1_9MOLU|nr:UPF0236 family protein [Williamsoniiplasma lucivorax]PPE06010.1 hypothetical protein ELUCI_v1c03010 [Williamsoniiplasma lucivorax]